MSFLLCGTLSCFACSRVWGFCFGFGVLVVVLFFILFIYLFGAGNSGKSESV